MVFFFTKVKPFLKSQIFLLFFVVKTMENFEFLGPPIAERLFSATLILHKVHKYNSS